MVKKIEFESEPRKINETPSSMRAIGFLVPITGP